MSRRRDVNYHFLHDVRLGSQNPLLAVFTLVGDLIQSKDHLCAGDSQFISLFLISLFLKLQIYISDGYCISTLKYLLYTSNITCLKTELLIFVTCPYLPSQSVCPHYFLSQSMAPSSVLFFLAFLQLPTPTYFISTSNSIIPRICPEPYHVSPYFLLAPQSKYAIYCFFARTVM